MTMEKIISCFLVGMAALFFSVAEAKEIRYHRGDRRDPFLPLTGPHAVRGDSGVGKDDLPVEGIVFDAKKGSYAVIAGEIYREGENVNGAQLIKVLPDRVILNQQSEEVVVWLREEVLPKDKEKSAKDDAA